MYCIKVFNGKEYLYTEVTVDTYKGWVSDNMLLMLEKSIEMIELNKEEAEQGLRKWTGQ